MAYLNWISDTDLITIVRSILDKAFEIKKLAKTNMNKNVIDPFSSLFQISGFQLDYDNWLDGEINRQAQKSLQNHIGDFHQNILGSVKGWDNLKVGTVIDLVNKNRKIIAEVKNKHNTVKKSDLAGIYETLDKAISNKLSIYKDYTAYYVVIIPPKLSRINKPFEPSDNKQGKRKAVNQNIREIDGASFYELVTGDKDALRNLFLILPTVIKDIIGKELIENELNSLLNHYNQAFID